MSRGVEVVLYTYVHVATHVHIAVIHVPVIHGRMIHYVGNNISVDDLTVEDCYVIAFETSDQFLQLAGMRPRPYTESLAFVFGSEIHPRFSYEYSTDP